MQQETSQAKTWDIKPEGWASAPTLATLKQEYNDAKIDTDSQVTKVDGWISNLNIKNLPAKQNRPNRSTVQPKLIRKLAEWRTPSLSDPFLSTRDLFNVSPVTFEDTKAAEQNALILNHQFNNKIKKVKFIGEYVRTGVEEGTIICRTGWHYREKIERVEETVYTYSVSDNPQIAQVYAQAQQLASTNPAAFENVPEYIRKGIEASELNNQLILAQPAGTEVVDKTVVVANHPTVDICDYRDVVIDPTCGNDLEKARFITYRFESSLSELKEEGDRYQNLDKINVRQENILAEADTDEENTTFQFEDDLRKKLYVYEYWGFADIEGNGVLKPIVAAWVGNTMIRMEENPFPDGGLPFVVVPFLHVRKSLFGEPDGALLEDNQKVMGAVMRGMLDLMGRSANGQQGTRKDALDFVNRRRFERGDDYEYNGGIDPGAAFHMHTYPEIPASAQFMLQQQNMDAESLTGVKAFNSGMSSSSLGEVAAGIRGVLDAATKRETDILRRLADGIVQIGRKFIAMNAVWLSEEEVVRVTNTEFVTVRREDLAGELDLELSISTAEEDEARSEKLSFMLQTIGPNTDPKIVFKIMAKIARLQKMPELAHDLENFEPQPDPLAVEKAQLEIELLKAQIAQIANGSEATGVKAALDEAKIGTEHAKANQLDAQADQATLDFVEQETGVKQERDLQKQGEQARANMQLEAIKAKLNKMNNPTK